ncbi:methylosome protein 50-like [Dreissena polymorpha]|uniref:Methylosome protein 50 n=1 Tax=Dreissena polymorpha TaxID=45954 RepID=A0A9D4CZA5_DREPO|nr:methylosome protein 50-like [Dreissena polymorpha]KAH3735735.1 hypothetical protein DPMN_042270 [Dreissena polymorpha]
MEQTPAAMDRHFEVIQYRKEGGVLLGASSLTGRYWFGSLWYYEDPEVAPDVDKCTAGVQLEAGLNDACWVDDKRVLVGMDTGGLALWELTDNLHTFIEQSSATEHDDLVSSVCVCASSGRFLSASHDRCIKVWDQETLRSINTYRAHAGVVHSVCSHPSIPEVFLSTSQDGTVCLWDTRKPKPVSKLDKSPMRSAPTCIAWQPGVDNVYAVGSECGLLVFKDTRSAVTETISLRPHHRGITRVQFQPDKNSTLASVSEDCTVMVVDIAEEHPKQLYRSTQHSDFIRGLSWANDGSNVQKFITCGWDSRVFSHLVPSFSDATIMGGEHIKMEVNGEPEATESVVSKIKDNGFVATKYEVLTNGEGNFGDVQQECTAETHS